MLCNSCFHLEIDKITVHDKSEKIKPAKNPCYGPC